MKNVSPTRTRKKYLVTKKTQQMENLTSDVAYTARSTAKKSFNMLVPFGLAFVMIFATSLAVTQVKDAKVLGELEQYMVPITFAVMAVVLSATGAQARMENLLSAPTGRFNLGPRPAMMLAYLGQVVGLSALFILMQYLVANATKQLNDFTESN